MLEDGTQRDSAADQSATRKDPFERIADAADKAFGQRPDARRELTGRILEDPRMHDHREGFLSCIQCGICTSGCPAARFTEYSPREIARRALDGDETLLTDDVVWYCFSCYTCQSRCPRGNSVALVNQVLRSMQVESGYGRKHVEMFAKWGEQFYEKGMGGTPHVFFDEIADAWGDSWKKFIAHRDELRETLGLGSMYPSPDAVAEVQILFEKTGFVDRLLSVGGWGGRRPHTQALAAPEQPADPHVASTGAGGAETEGAESE